MLVAAVGVVAVVVFVAVADVLVAADWVAPELAPPVPALLAAAWWPEVSCETVEVTCDAAPSATDPAAERAVGAGFPARGLVSVVAACACRENTSMIRKIPAATVASCTARRAMRRAMGCVMTAPRWPGTWNHCSVTTVQRIRVSHKRRWMTLRAHP